MKWIAIIALVAALAGCSGDADSPYTNSADTVDGVDGTDGLTASDGADGADGVDGGTGTVPPKITACSNELPAPETGTCRVEPGDAKLLIQGTIATPNGLLEKGQLVINMGKIACVGCDCAEKAAGATVFSCPDGLITPGLINPHDHTGWTQTAPKSHGDIRYDHRHEWREGLNGKPEIKTPKNSSSKWGKQYGELRMVMSGVTSLMGSGGVSGFTRNLDVKSQLEGLLCPVADNPTFPLKDVGGQMIAEGCSGYPGIPKASAISSTVAYVPHVAEGVTEHARNEFMCLSGQVPGSVDAVVDHAAFIHGIGLTAADVALMANDFAGLIWSPRSNISLYGFTADVGLFNQLGVQIALGSDWVPSGSMNMIRELACADYLNQAHYGGYFSDKGILDMGTANAADLTGFGAKLGRLQDGLLADIAIFDASVNKSYRAVLDAGPADVVLVLREGEALYGDAALVDALAAAENCDALDVCGRAKRACVNREIGLSYDGLMAEINSADSASYKTYPLYFCDGPPEDEPTCVPSRPGEFTGITTETDIDGDGVLNANDNCPSFFNPPRPMDKGVQPDVDGDGAGDACDVCPFDANVDECKKPNVSDIDGDGLDNNKDNCPQVANPGQENTDGDLHGDACDACPEHPDPCPATIYQIKKGEVKEQTRVSLPPLVVTAVGEKGYFVQHHPSTEGYEGPKFSGVFVFDNAGVPLVKPGDQVVMDANVSSYFGQTQLDSPNMKVLSTPLGEPAPVEVVDPASVATGGADAAAYEGVLIALGPVEVIDIKPLTDEGDDTGEFQVTGDLLVDDLFYKVVPWPQKGAIFKGITGVLRWNWNNTKVAPRSLGDLILGPPMLMKFGPELVYIKEGVQGSTVPPLTVYLTGPAQEPASVEITSLSPGSALPLTTSVQVPVGANSAEVQVNALAGGNTPVTFQAKYGDVALTADVRVIGANESPVVSSLLPAKAQVVAGKTLELTVSLSLPAGAGGQAVELTADVPSMVTLPPTFVIAEGELSSSLSVAVGDVLGTVNISATTEVGGAAQAQSTIEVLEAAPLGLVLLEVFYDPKGADDGGEWIKLYNGTNAPLDLSGYSLGWGGANYTNGVLALTGVVPAGGCFLLGGPTSNPDNGSPVYELTTNLNPDLQNSSTAGAADAVALFDVPNITAATIPIDAVVYGVQNSNNLLDEEGTPGAVDIGKLKSGESMLRTVDGWKMNPTPNSVSCPAPL